MRNQGVSDMVRLARAELEGGPEPCSDILPSVGTAPIERFEGRLDDVRSLIGRGLARLMVCEYPWGVELGVEATHPGRREARRDRPQG